MMKTNETQHEMSLQEKAICLALAGRKPELPYPLKEVKCADGTVQRIYQKQLNGAGKSKVVISAPKSRTSAREIPIAPILLPVLERLRKEDAECYFIGGNAKCSEVRTYREFYDRFLARNNLTHIRFHALRHTFATRCIEAGGDCKTVSELLGHSTVNLTLNLYVHPQMAQKRQCIESLSY